MFLVSKEEPKAQGFAVALADVVLVLSLLDNPKEYEPDGRPL